MDLKEYKTKLGKLSLNDEKLRDLYLRDLALGKIEGPPTGYATIDKPWVKAKKSNKNMPTDDMSVYDYLYECNKNNLDDIALIYDPIMEMPATNITFKSFFEKIDEGAKAYISLGVRKGDIVTVSLPSFVENIVSFYALNKIGAVSNQIHPMASRDEIEFYLEEAKSAIFLGYGDVYEKIKTIDNPYLKYVIITNPIDSIDMNLKLDLLKKMKADIRNNSLEGICTSWTDFINNGKSVTDLDKYVSHDSSLLAALTHTSGTTGKSKAVMTTSYAFNSSVSSIAGVTNGFQRQDKELLILPPFPLYILNNVVHLSLSHGEQLVVIPKVDYSKLSVYFKKHRPQHVKGIPSTIESILNDKGFDDYDMSDFKFLISGGGKLTKEDDINEFLLSHHCKYRIANGYGMSEVGGCVSCMFENTKIDGTVGKPILNSSAMAVDLNTGKELSYFSNENGEIYLIGSSRMIGYYQNKEATEELFFYDKINKKTWVKTGDLGRISEDGDIIIVGRLKRMTFIFDSVNNTASKVSSDYMESTICDNNDVIDCIVISVPDEVSQNAMKAYILVKDSPYDRVIDELDKMCKKRFRKYVSPIEYVVVDEIPKNVAGKNDYKYVEEMEFGKIDNPRVKVLYRRKIEER